MPFLSTGLIVEDCNDSRACCYLVVIRTLHTTELTVLILLLSSIGRHAAFSEESSFLE